ncbi:MAG: HD domain-containing protein [Gemmatimonadetes bacterium]|nr:HD domain-containing protein [Gemmatimonadota bacterium]MYA43586.1 HD domain-containing protein [Gemmatimonadota bacterium]MYE92666.1 HD domain-containing protein [Gemmatimonadota bacterium]MYJ11820.1 HD domain-containing protein [Gemmatimonadota bacterium]
MGLRLTSRFEDALVFAAQLHREQCRKGSNVPYVSHLLAVSSLVIEHGGDEDQAIAALLHDAIEDQGGPPTRDRILRRFGERVTRIVEGCTDSQADPKPPWRARKEAFIAGISEKPPSVQLVCAADKLHNARCILSDYRNVGEKVWERFKGGGREGTLWYYRELANALLPSGPTELVDELERVVGEIERLADKKRG